MDTGNGIVIFLAGLFLLILGALIVIFHRRLESNLPSESQSRGTGWSSSRKWAVMFSGISLIALGIFATVFYFLFAR